MSSNNCGAGGTFSGSMCGGDCGCCSAVPSAAPTVDYVTTATVTSSFIISNFTCDDYDDDADDSISSSVSVTLSDYTAASVSNTSCTESSRRRRLDGSRVLLSSDEVSTLEYLLFIEMETNGYDGDDDVKALEQDLVEKLTSAVLNQTLENNIVSLAVEGHPLVNHRVEVAKSLAAIKNNTAVIATTVVARGGDGSPTTTVTGGSGDGKENVGVLALIIIVGVFAVLVGSCVLFGERSRRNNTATPAIEKSAGTGAGGKQTGEVGAALRVVAGELPTQIKREPAGSKQRTIDARGPFAPGEDPAANDDGGKPDIVDYDVADSSSAICISSC